MTLVPVIERELRSEARNAFTYWLRVVGAATLLIAGGSFWLMESVTLGNGSVWFSAMHQTLFWSIWVLVPAMTADCISREKREGTLGLLFLTPLRAMDVVLAKGLAHGLRAAALGLASIPVLVLPFLMGGISWGEAVTSLSINFSALCWALAAGLLASSRNRTLSRALAAAAAWSVLFFLTFAAMLGVAYVAVIAAWAPGFRVRLAGLEEMIERPLGIGYLATVRFRLFWEDMRFVAPAAATPAAAISAAAVASLSLLMFLGLLFATAANVRRLWQDRPRSALREKMESRFYRPSVGTGLYRAWMRRLIERNPVGWLERRTWQARMVTWVWIAVIGCVVSAAANDPRFFRANFSEWLMTLASLLCASIAFSAAGSFRRERETGVMELLLVSPLGVGRIIQGRLHGLWGQFGPGVGLFAASWIYLIPALARSFGGMGGGGSVVAVIWLFCNTALTLPVVGLYFSLCSRLFILAALLTMMGGVITPLMGPLLLGEMMVQMLGFPSSIIPMIGLPLAGGLLLRSWRRTVERRWMLEVIATSAVLAGIGAFLIHFLGEDRRASVELAGAVLCGAIFQTTLAIWLGSHLSRDLAARRFSLPQ